MGDYSPYHFDILQTVCVSVSRATEPVLVSLLPLSNFYLCLCRLAYSSLPILPFLLFSLLLVGNAQHVGASSLSVFIQSLCHQVRSKYKDLKQTWPGHHLISVQPTTLHIRPVVAWWPLRIKEGQNCHPGRHRGRLQWMQSSGDTKPNLHESDLIGNVQWLQSEQPKESDNPMENPGQKQNL